jgi:hypothetical protein
MPRWSSGLGYRTFNPCERRFESDTGYVGRDATNSLGENPVVYMQEHGLCGCRLAAKAPALQAGNRRFESSHPYCARVGLTAGSVRALGLTGVTLLKADNGPVTDSGFDSHQIHK